MKEEQILKAAKKLISKYGYKKVSMDEIADEAGVTKKTVYSYFESKEELLNALIRKELEKMKKDLEVLEQEKGDLLVSIHEGIYNLLKFRRKNNLFKILFEEAEVVKNAKLKACLSVIEEDIIAYIKSVLEDANKQGKIEVKNIDVMAFLIYKMYIALMMEWNDNYKKIDEKEVADNILQVLEHGIIRKEVEK
ncbi:MAG: TetR/AcrR family transcriptional regulator [Clostridia bacterium]|nr:TetR/AcrR family transcriptional regulator [Clostridia bacterium]